MKLLTIESCRECGSRALFIFPANIVINGVQQNRLNTHDVRCQFVLGCDECGETLRIVSADTVAEYLMQLRTSTAHQQQEGE